VQRQGGRVIRLEESPDGLGRLGALVQPDEELHVERGDLAPQLLDFALRVAHDAGVDQGNRAGAVCHDTVGRDVLADLNRKYEEMLRMRLHDAEHPGGDPRREMAALAARFPGALRELDEAPLDVIRTRIDALRRCLDSDAPPEPWMHAAALYHSLARGALLAKRWLAGRKVVDDALVDAFILAFDGTPQGADGMAWAADLALVAAPPRGRLNDLVFERVAAEMGLPVREARRLVLGPPRRERPPRA